MKEIGEQNDTKVTLEVFVHGADVEDFKKELMDFLMNNDIPLERIKIK